MIWLKIKNPLLKKKSLKWILGDLKLNFSKRQLIFLNKFLKLNKVKSDIGLWKTNSAQKQIFSVPKVTKLRWQSKYWRRGDVLKYKCKVKLLMSLKSDKESSGVFCLLNKCVFWHFNNLEGCLWWVMFPPSQTQMLGLSIGAAKWVKEKQWSVAMGANDHPQKKASGEKSSSSRTGSAPWHLFPLEATDKMILLTVSPGQW